MSKRAQCPTICRICNGPANGYHYEVASCNGCKTFFRRCITTGRRFECKQGDGKCVILMDSDINKRKKPHMCRACRFEKCVSAGMNPLAIQAECQNGDNLKNEVISVIAETVPRAPSSESPLYLIHQLEAIESKSQQLHRHGAPVGYTDPRTLNDIIYSNPSLDTINHHHQLDASGSTTPLRFFHSSVLACVEMCKTLDFCQRISHQSLIRLVKHVSVMCSNLACAFFSISVMKSDRLVNPDGSIVAGKWLNNSYNPERYMKMQRAVIALLRLKPDTVEYMLLKVILMCNPAVCLIPPEDQMEIEMERQKYAKCLFQYCCRQNGAIHGSTRFTDLISVSTVLENMQKDQKDFHVYLKTVIFPNRRCNASFHLSHLLEEILSD